MTENRRDFLRKSLKIGAVAGATAAIANEGLKIVRQLHQMIVPQVQVVAWFVEKLSKKRFFIRKITYGNNTIELLIKG